MTNNKNKTGSDWNPEDVIGVEDSTGKDWVAYDDFLRLKELWKKSVEDLEDERYQNAMNENARD